MTIYNYRVIDYVSSYTDIGVLSVIEKLTDRGEHVTASRIAQVCGGNRCTAQDAIRRLIAAGYIRRTGAPRTGYHYEVLASVV